MHNYCARQAIKESPLSAYAIAKKYNISQTVRDRPWTNGMVERFNRTA